jgi:hypothetical protein
MFTVRWIQTALDELTTIWMKADSASRRDITAAAHTIDEELQNDPEQKGESREENEHVFCAQPLGALYEVDTAASTVWVLHV